MHHLVIVSGLRAEAGGRSGPSPGKYAAVEELVVVLTQCWTLRGPLAVAASFLRAVGLFWTQLIYFATRLRFALFC